MHTSSLFLPPGNYLVTCQFVTFYPCMGNGNQGLLTAMCANLRLKFVEGKLEDADGQCRMSNLGYVSNDGGTLRCDPDIEFNNVDPNQGSGLLQHFQCNQ